MILSPFPIVRPSEDATFVVVPVPGARVAAISADGRTVVGTAENRAFAWRRSDATDGHGTIETLSNPGAALAVSDDGSVIVGNGVQPARLERGGRWWIGSLLAAPPPWGPRIGGAAVGVSGDGAVVVGTTVLNYEVRGGQSRHAEGYGEAAFLHERSLNARRAEPKSGDSKPDETQSGVPISSEPVAAGGNPIERGIGELIEDPLGESAAPVRALREQPEPSRGFALGWGSAATAVSGDGATIVGTLARPGVGFRWTEGGTILPIGDLPGGRIETIPNAVNADGATIVGSAVSGNGIEAFRWTAEDGMVGLGDLPGGRFRSVARAVSADGTIVVGVAAGPEGDRAFVWSAAKGMRPLDELVPVPAGWSLAEAVAVRPVPGGLLVAGNGTDADGRPAAFLATLARPE